ncbi:ABC transporter permease [uncultured Selenomonas sp.]|uniref:ABC transporter permease n=1 Tax=uncultured Selenomonas sp. TaxID=159275 RepID=UPI0028DC60D1|nr:ABC transporter permease [uncultured Selenomonas sp.]
MKNAKHLLGAAALTLLVWQAIAALGGWHEALFPSPAAALSGLGELIADGALLQGVAASLMRFAVGYISSVLIALIAGLILGWYSKVWAYLNPIVQVLRPISPVAWLPFIVLFFGIGEAPAIVIIFLAAFFPVLLATIAAVQKLDPIYLKVAQNFGIGTPAIFTKIILPAIFPQIATGLHLALGTAWVFLVAGEMVGAQSGLGFLIIDARNNLRADLLMAAIIAIGLLGLLLDSAMSLAERRLCRAWGIQGGK